MESKNTYSVDSLLSDIHLTLGFIARGKVLSIKALYQTLQEISKQEGLKIVYMKIGNDKLYITKQMPADWETEKP